MSPRRGPLIPPLMGTQATRVPGLPASRLFQQVRTLAGQGHGQKPPVTLPRYATLESARLIHCPSMGLLRRPTPGEIVEGGRLGRPCGPGAHSRAFQKTNLRLRRHSHISTHGVLSLTDHCRNPGGLLREVRPKGAGDGGCLMPPLRPPWPWRGPVPGRRPLRGFRREVHGRG